MTERSWGSPREHTVRNPRELCEQGADTFRLSCRYGRIVPFLAVVAA